MSDYCYQCLECGRFKEECICDCFKDPLEEIDEMIEEVYFN